MSSGSSFQSRISGTHRSSTHNEETPEDCRKSGLMLALSFDDDANMQSYLKEMPVVKLKYQSGKRKRSVSDGVKSVSAKP